MSASTTPAWRSGGPEAQATARRFRNVLRLNLEAVFALSQAVAQPMRDQGSGSMINISSMFGLVASAPVPDAGYVASKSAVNGLTRELASQWARDGIRVNAIAPGFFASEMTAELVRGRTLAALVRARAARWDGRGGPRSSTGSCSSSRRTRRRYCTGQVFAIDGGWTIR